MVHPPSLGLVLERFHRNGWKQTDGSRKKTIGWTDEQTHHIAVVVVLGGIGAQAGLRCDHRRKETGSQFKNDHIHSTTRLHVDENDPK